MKPYRLLSTAAVALLFTAGAASAQMLKKDESPAASPRAQQTAPAEKIAPPMNSGQHKAGAKPAETTGQAAPKGSSDANEMKAKPHERATQAPAQPGVKPNQSSTREKSGTTGQGAAAGSGKLSSEQRTKITTIIKQQKMEPARVKFSVAVGARVPSSVRFYPLPVEVIAIYPEWRGYNYVMVGDEILVIDPRTHEIVAILEA